MATLLSLGNRMSLPAVALLYLSYAGTPLPAATDDISLNVVAAANDGSPLRPHITEGKNGDVTAWEEPITQLNGKETHQLPEECMKDYLDAMIAKIDRKPIVGGRRKILIFTHGGMNRRNGAIVRAYRIRPELESDNYYPIFIAWNSEAFSCYGEHLFRIRQGQFRHLSYALPTMPFYLLADVARGTSRAPVVWTRLTENALTQPAGLLKTTIHAQRMVYGQEANTYLRKTGQPAADATAKNIRDSDYRGSETNLPSIAHTLSAPTKTVGALLLDIIGTSSWDVMVRRANVLFDSPVRPEDFAKSKTDPRPGLSDGERIRIITEMVQKRKSGGQGKPVDQKTIDKELKVLLGKPRTNQRKADFYARSRPGAVELLMQRLEAEQRKGKRYSITLVGHSMGAIVSNEMIKRHPDLFFDRVVYLAAACSVRDCQGSMVPYMLAQKAKNHPVQFYNLSLHPIAEVSEALSGDRGAVSLGGLGKTAAGVILVPRGSLLEWLDGFFTKPMTAEDRRLGKWETAITSVGIFPEEIRDSVHLKMFPVGVRNSKVPEKHGSFADGKGEVHFWEESFLDPLTEYQRDKGPQPAGSGSR